MPVLFYLIKLSLTIALLFLFYQLVLRRLTFYTWNRWYLLLYTLLSFFIPFIDISPAVNSSKLEGIQLIRSIPVVENLKPLASAPLVLQSETGHNWNLLLLLFLSGVVLLLTRLLVVYGAYRKLKRNALLISEGKVCIYQVDQTIIPFSFGRSIFINQNLQQGNDLEEIIRHEFVHVRQRHTIDIVWSEVFCAFNWYNPFAWLIRHSIRQNLEFIADSHVLQGGIDKKQYQYLLLKVMGSDRMRIASQFNFSSLKKRIIMMNKNQSARASLLRFLFMLPLLAVLLLAFRRDSFSSLSFERAHISKPSSPDATATVRQPLYSTAPVQPTTTHLQKSRALPKDTLPNEAHGFLQRNPAVRDVSWQSQPFRLLIHFKNGRTETYRLENSEEVKKAEALYGPLPVAPPPPPARARTQNASSAQLNAMDDATGTSYQKKDDIVFSADTVTLNNAPPVVILKGYGTFRFDAISTPGSESPKLLYIDGEEVVVGKTYELNANTEYIIEKLESAQAVKKYGQKGAQGAVEINKRPQKH